MPKPNSNNSAPNSRMHTLLTSVMQEIYSNTAPREWRTAQEEYMAAHSRWPSHTLQTMLQTLNTTRDSIRNERCSEYDEKRNHEDETYYGGENSENTDERQVRVNKEQDTMVLCPNWLTDDWMKEQQHVRYEENKILFDNCRVLISYIQSLEECSCVYCEI